MVDVQPFWSLSEAQALELLDAIYQPGRRFERALHYYWEHVLGLPEEVARARTAAELRELHDTIRSRAGDPDVYALLIGGVAAGTFSLRPLAEHSRGAAIAAVVDGHPILAARYPGQRAIAHAVCLRDERASLSNLRAMFYFIACTAEARAFDHIFFFSSDLRLRTVYQKFGIEFPAELAFDDSLHLVGAYTPQTPCNRDELARTRALLFSREPRHARAD